MTTHFEATSRTRLRRRPARGAYDEASVFAILDAGLIAHVGYAEGGAPRVIATAYWREGRTLYWHGAAGSQALRAQAGGIPVCVTVSHLDGLVLGRSGFAHSVLYRSVMAFGNTHEIESREGKRRAMDAFLERLYPGRTREIRPVHDAELDMIAVIALPIDEASAKVRGGGVNEKEEDLAGPGWAGVIPVETRLCAVRTDERVAGVALAASVGAYAEGAGLGAVLAKNARTHPA
ncbi:MAG TPA: pyridoxamine 5'-phosphate oxidase family protein [Myxococcota bacterium]|nr:pyridoxamine 5'-phosphate oxidase family protein [Myxococcota bacterium]